MIKVRLETEFSGPDLQAYFCIEMKPWESTVSRGKKYEDGKKCQAGKKRKKVASWGHIQKPSQKTAIQFYSGLGCT